MSYKVVHYINQFFANIGGEEMAHVAPELREGYVGPGMRSIPPGRERLRSSAPLSAATPTSPSTRRTPRSRFSTG